MNATILEIDPWESTGFELAGTTIYARGVRAQSRRRCPHCGSVVYSRRHRLCGVCFERLPEPCLFSAQESSSVEALLAEERQRHRAWLHKTSS